MTDHDQIMTHSSCLPIARVEIAARVTNVEVSRVCRLCESRSGLEASLLCDYFSSCDLLGASQSTRSDRAGSVVGAVALSQRAERTPLTPSPRTPTNRDA